MFFIFYNNNEKSDFIIENSLKGLRNMNLRDYQLMINLLEDNHEYQLTQ